jgi:hypothetical protein
VGSLTPVWPATANQALAPPAGDDEAKAAWWRFGFPTKLVSNPHFWFYIVIPIF